MEKRTGKAQLKHLGKVSNAPVSEVELIPWHGRNITVVLDCTEFTSFCPVTRQPDFGQLLIEYVPDKFIIETKSMKLFLRSFRDAKAFNEVLVDGIANRLFQQLKPKSLLVKGRFNYRGGISVTAVARR